MDRLEIKIISEKVDKQYEKLAEIRINDRPIIDILREFELPLAKKENSENIAGAYMYLSPKNLYQNLTKNENFNEERKATILACECGSEGCWPMLVKIKEDEKAIIWEDFEQPHRTIERGNYWDYQSFGKYIFDLYEYKKQLKSLT